MTRLASIVSGLLPLLAVAQAKANLPELPEDLSTPMQQRLAVAGLRAMSVGWNTYGQINESCVAYGLSESALTQTVCNTDAATYSTSRTSAHAVTLPNLTPATTYYYKIQSTNSSVEHFLSPRDPGDKTPFTMNVVIDLGVYGADGFTKKNAKRDTIPLVDPALNHTTIMALAQTVDDYELVIHPGDFAYADDWFLKAHNLLDGENAYQAIMEQFYGQLAPVSGRKAYMASPGNHEATCSEVPALNRLCPGGQKNFTDFMIRFGRTMPTAFGSASANVTAKSQAATARELAVPPFWYSFEYGMAHVVMINTETDFPDAPDEGFTLNGGPFGRDGQQLAFLEADLASVDRSVTPWIIVAGHRPWYTTGGSVCDACQSAFEPLMYKYGVDLGVFGHVHNAQRFLPTNNSQVDAAGLNDPKAPAYIIAGGAGNIEGTSAIGSNMTGNVFAYEDDFSYASISFQDENHLKIDFFQSSTGTLLESSVLFKSHKQQFVVQ